MAQTPNHTDKSKDSIQLQKPKGSAGDSKNGFNLQDAMGLANNDKEYNAILVSV